MEAASFSTQANALLRKNITFQKRNKKTNLCILVFPILLCLLLVALQRVVDKELDKSGSQCGCICLNEAADGTCNEQRQCGLKYSSPDRASFCAVRSPPEWLPLLQVPESRSALCWQNGSCPVTVLLTGGNKSFATSVAESFFGTLPNTTSPNTSTILSTLTLGSSSGTESDNFIEPAFSEGMLYSVQPACPMNSSAEVRIEKDGAAPFIRLECVKASSLWRNSSSEVNKELYSSYNRSNTDRRGTGYMAAYDFLDTNKSSFNVRVWYNSVNKDGGYWGSPPSQRRIVRSVNVITNAYLKHLKGPGTNMLFEFIKEMPKPATKLLLDFSSLLGPLFFKWVIELIFPVLLINLVYEKQHKLRIMMKMHGLGDGPYWIISYGYFLLISVVYVLFLVVFGSLTGLKFFSMQDYSLQFVFYFAFVNLQIVFAFLASTIFTNVKSAQAVAYIYIFGSGLLAAFLFQPFIQDLSFPKSWIRVMELIPAFSLFRMLYEFGEYSFNGRYTGTTGMQWKDLKDDMNGMKEVLIIIVLEWFLLLPLAYYTDQPTSEGDRIHKNPLFFLPHFKKKFVSSFRRPGLERLGSKVLVEVEKPDVIQERTMVEQLRQEPKSGHAIISDDLKKVYRGQDGNPDKLAVEGLSLALPRGECFGMLGPNGAGKTTFINMMIGLIAPTSGNAYVEGYSIMTDMDKIYTSMGVCPQKDMLWETLTGREHLLFYGRLKNLNGRALTQAVDESLRSVNLFHGGVGEKQVRKYSGGMKRRLSVAISLIGDPKVVYMDEPSTGLDPASRNNLWNVVKKAKQNRAIILTTHSMEEAEVLCDRLGIFVGGALQCIGNPKQLKARYGETYVFTMTTTPEQEQAVERLVLSLSSNASKVYHIPGTLKFEIPKQDVKIADVFKAVEAVKRRLPVQAWGLANTTLEDVFIKVAKGASSQSELS